MKLLVISPKCSTLSAKKLAKAIGATYNNYYKDAPDTKGYDGVINYGVSALFPYNNVVNRPESVMNCVNKITTLNTLSKENIPVPNFTTSKRMALNSGWNIVVCRKDVGGNNGKEMEYCYDLKKLPDATLYTEYFEHNYELRVVTLFGKVVGFYEKVRKENDQWHFTPRKPTKEISDAAIKAADVLGIDFVGFDIVCKTSKDFKILEANSGPIITDEVIQAFSNYLK